MLQLTGNKGIGSLREFRELFSTLHICARVRVRARARMRERLELSSLSSQLINSLYILFFFTMAYRSGACFFDAPGWGGEAPKPLVPVIYRERAVSNQGTRA